MKKVELINSNLNLGFGGAYLDPWTNHGMVRAVFTENKDHYQISVFDQKQRPRVENVPKKTYFETYWQLILRGWKPTK